MPVLSAKTQSSGFEALAAKVEAKKREEREKEILDETLKKLAIKSLEKENANIASTKDREANFNYNVSLKSSTIEDREKQVQTEPIRRNRDASKNENERKYERSSIISGSQKIQELQEIQKQLNKSYEPKPLFEPRRPTMESIKSAIEKSKQDEARRNKMVGTEGDDVVTIISTSDATTSVENIRKKKPKKKKTLDIVAANSAGITPTVTKAIINTNKDKTIKNKRVTHKTKKKIGVDVTIVKTINEDIPSWTDEQTAGKSTD